MRQAEEVKGDGARENGGAAEEDGDAADKGTEVRSHDVPFPMSERERGCNGAIMPKKTEKGSGPRAAFLYSASVYERFIWH
jgi:hypothetical protein